LTDQETAAIHDIKRLLFTLDQLRFVGVALLETESDSFYDFLAGFQQALEDRELTAADFDDALKWKNIIADNPVLPTPFENTAVDLLDKLIKLSTGPAVLKGNPEQPPGCAQPCTPPPPCECTAIGAFANHVTHPGHNIEGFEFDLHWAVVCTPGAGPGCKGLIKVVPPPGEGIRLVRPPGANQIAEVNCKGPCGLGSSFGLGTGTGTVEWVTTRSSGFDLANRINKSFPLKLEFFCIDNASAQHLVGTSTLTLRFNRFGTLSYEHSDLNGDGKPDGKQLH
jgi:hypothetical protein